MSLRTSVLSPEQAAMAARVQQMGEARLAAAEPTRRVTKIRAPRSRDPVSIGTWFKRLNSGNAKASLTAEEKRRALASHAARVAAMKPTPQPQMIAQGHIDAFIGEMLTEFELEAARDNAEQVMSVYLAGVGWFPSPAALRAYVEAN